MFNDYDNNYVLYFIMGIKYFLNILFVFFYKYKDIFIKCMLNKIK